MAVAPTLLLQLSQAGLGHLSLQGMGLAAGARAVRPGRRNRFLASGQQPPNRPTAQPRGKSSQSAKMILDGNNLQEEEPLYQEREASLGPDTATGWHLNVPFWISACPFCHS